MITRARAQRCRGLVLLQKLWRNVRRSVVPPKHVHVSELTVFHETIRRAGVMKYFATTACVMTKKNHPEPAADRRFTVQNMVATFEMDAPISLELMAYNRARWVGGVGRGRTWLEGAASKPPFPAMASLWIFAMHCSGLSGSSCFAHTPVRRSLGFCHIGAWDQQ